MLVECFLVVQKMSISFGGEELDSVVGHISVHLRFLVGIGILSKLNGVVVGTNDD